MNSDLDTALEAEIVAQGLIRLAERLRNSTTQASAFAELAVNTGAGSRKREAYFALATRIYEMRRQRTEFWPAELFGEPAWDIMLDLYIRECEGREVNVTSVCIASSVPQSTALRWVSLLESNGLIERRGAPHDFRVQYLRLTKDGSQRMQRFLRQTKGDHLGATEPLLLRAK
jgi:DNA-binding MarR family transcriptional regulator